MMITSSQHICTSPGFPWLVADIGGSNARFGWVAGHGQPASHVLTLPVAQYPDLVGAARDYLLHIQQLLGAEYAPPLRAAFAVATAVADDRIAFTNSHWNFSQAETRAALQLDRLITLNDFESLALSLPHLRANQIKPYWGTPHARGTLAVIGPGTGLGVAAVIQTAHGWVAIPGEGGHVSAAATTDYEAALLTHLRLRYPHISAERLLSGIGLPILYAGVAHLEGIEVPEQRVAPEIILERGLAGEHPYAKTLDVFCAMLGSFAGNVALTVGALGGVYIGGGIVPRLGDHFFESRFRSCFEAKGRFGDYLKRIPVALITDTLAALTGAAASLEQHLE